MNVSFEHPTIALDYHGEQVDIDQDIAPLLGLAWAAGLDTLASCQGDDERPAYVLFTTPEDARLFVELIVGDEDPAADTFGLACRALQCQPFTVYLDPERDAAEAHRWARTWQYDVSPRGPDYTSVIRGRGPVRLYVNVQFPPSDIPALTERLASYTEGEAS